jgi:uncharacterized protein DUF1592/uncharacterized protein DUF1588
VALATAEQAGGATFELSMQQVVTAMLMSAPFLMRLEFDTDPNSRAPHPLSGYELASRLSYLLWSSMPDDQLFAAAEDGSLQTPAVLEAQVDRMLADPRGAGFTEGFARQWLGADEVANRAFDGVEVVLDQALRDAMGTELRLYFGDFVQKDLDVSTFLDADFTYVDAQLGQFYGMAPTGLGTAWVRVSDTTGRRTGFLGTAAFLMQTSYSSRSSFTGRGLSILERFFCQSAPGVPTGTPDAAPSVAQSARAFSDSIEANAQCATCHKTMDAMGMTLEEFDQLGVYRTTYTDGTPVDAAGTLRDGTPAGDELALAHGLAADPGFLPCVSQKLHSFAVNRTLRLADAPFIQQVLEQWLSGGTPTLRGLLKILVVNDTFRLRRGGGEP